jgi:NAD(P)-dependent dehydrogenase (short-subunit alcohol dehydrogenase family)
VVTTEARRSRALKATPAGRHRRLRALKAKVHSAKVLDHEGIKTLLRRAEERFPRLSHLWLDAGYRGEHKGADWARKTLGWSVELVERPRKPPEGVLMAWAREWAKEAVAVIGGNCCPPKASWCCRGGGWSVRCHGPPPTSKGG